MNIPLDEWNGSKATKELQAAIDRHQVENARIGGRMLQLTWAIAILTFVLLLGLGAQIWHALR